MWMGEEVGRKGGGIQLGRCVTQILPADSEGGNPRKPVVVFEEKNLLFLG